MQGDRGPGGQSPNDAVGISVGGNAWHAARGKGPSRAVDERRRGRRSRHVLAVGESEGFQGLARHAPIDPIRCAVAVNGGRGIALSPDGIDGLDDVVGGGTELAHLTCVRVHHVKIAGLVRADHDAGMGRSSPRGRQEALARRTHILVPAAHGGLAHGSEIIQRGHRVADGVQLEEALSVVGYRRGCVESAVCGEKIKISRRVHRRSVAGFPKGRLAAVGGGAIDA